jgi:ribonuclease HII
VLAAYFHTELIEAGLDEAGRGCLAGPVFAAAVILPKDFHHPLLNDSKQLKEADRETLRPVIEQAAVAWAVAEASAEEIDQINILQASLLAMHRAVDMLSVKPELLLVDGNRFKPYLGIPHQCFVKGDSRYAAIAAASILTKTYRDARMQALHQEFPHYGWARHKGYPTSAHKQAIAEWGLSPHHRRSFRSAI